jgi:hypothetical protein
MYTVVETPEFQAQAGKVWSDAERDGFIDWIASNPLAGDVIPGTDGARKVRWTVQGRGKRGGVRVVYFNLLDNGVVVLLMVYAKAERENVPRRDVKGAKHEFEND